MTFATLALISLVAVCGPLLALPKRVRVPVVLGELVAGIVLGRTGLRWLHPADQTFTFLADVGFGLVMFVAGTHVPVRDPRMRAAAAAGVLRAVLVGAVGAGLGTAVAALFGTGHPALYAVLMASSSAALVLPIVDSLGLGGDAVLQLLPQVAIADAACIVALPLAVDPAHAGRAAVGAAAVIACGVVLFAALRELDARGAIDRLRTVSVNGRFALELRISLVLLFGLAALAAQTHVSIMLSGFTLGLVIAATGEPRRLARQLFGLTEGLFAPLFFVWLGSSLNLRDFAGHPSYVLLGAALGAGAVLSHVALRLLAQPLPLGGLAAAQLGVPIAAATVGRQVGVLRPGEAAAIILGALVTIAVSVACAGRYVSPPMSDS